MRDAQRARHAPGILLALGALTALLAGCGTTARDEALTRRSLVLTPVSVEVPSSAVVVVPTE